MKHSKILIYAAISVVIAACDLINKNNYQTGIIDSVVNDIHFSKGADISWVTEMEKDGIRFYNAEGKETECTALMKEIGFDAIRLRVWVDPEGGWCGKKDVLVKARRAHALGMRIMIDFHYSDSWADPGKQNVPAGWKNFDAMKMSEAVKDHTYEVLMALKDEGIDVEWVQVGNEVNQGMLWPLGKVSGQSTERFLDFHNAGYDAVKQVYPKAMVILHISNGHDSELFDWFFSLMHDNRARYDVIGMSLYPSWWENGGWKDWKQNVDKCLANIKAVTSKFGKKVMICETGMPVSEPQMAKNAMEYILTQAEAIKECLGVFYWEPQTDGVWKPSNYSDLGWNAYNMGAFRDGRPTIALAPFKSR